MFDVEVAVLVVILTIALMAAIVTFYYLGVFDTPSRR